MLVTDIGSVCVTETDGALYNYVIKLYHIAYAMHTRALEFAYL